MSELEKMLEGFDDTPEGIAWGMVLDLSHALRNAARESADPIKVEEIIASRVDIDEAMTITTVAQITRDAGLRARLTFEPLDGGEETT